MSIESENARLRAELAELQRRVGAIRQPPSHEEANAKSAAFARADSVARLFGDKASAPLPTESAMAYRKRLVHRFKHHSPRFANESFDQPLSDASMGLVEDIIYSDAAGVAKDTSDGKLVSIQERDVAGRLITKYMGDPFAWMQAYMGTGHRGYINLRTPGKS
jgi:hypothetical protein